MLKVYKQCCKNCLFSDDRVVSTKAAKKIIEECVEQQTHFICHKASMNGEEIVCNSFYKNLGDRSQLIRIAKRIDAIVFIDQPNGDKLPTYKDLNS